MLCADGCIFHARSTASEVDTGASSSEGSSDGDEEENGEEDGMDTGEGLYILWWLFTNRISYVCVCVCVWHVYLGAAENKNEVGVMETDSKSQVGSRVQLCVEHCVHVCTCVYALGVL